MSTTFGRQIMKKLLCILCLLAGGCVQAPAADLAFRNATVVNVTDGTLRPDQTVLVAGNRILAVGPADAVRVSDEADVIDAAGRYLIGSYPHQRDIGIP